jgi:hypothetical protein
MPGQYTLQVDKTWYNNASLTFLEISIANHSSLIEFFLRSFDTAILITKMCCHSEATTQSGALHVPELPGNDWDGEDISESDVDSG